MLLVGWKVVVGVDVTKVGDSRYTYHWDRSSSLGQLVLSILRQRSSSIECGMVCAKGTPSCSKSLCHCGFLGDFDGAVLIGRRKGTTSPFSPTLIQCGC